MARGRKRIVSVVVAAALVTSPTAVAAPGDTEYRGRTAEGAKVKLTVASSGNATKFRLGRSEVDCDRGGTLSNEAYTYRKLDRSDPGSFYDKRVSRSTSGRFALKTKSKLGGSTGEAGDSWTGTFELRTKVREDGETVDVCRLTTTWTAS